MTSGRKRAFDEVTALSAAMEVFWAKGYVGASLSDLTQRMGINKPSLYSFFGNKETLFIKATEFYIENNAKSHLKLLFQPNVSFQFRLKNYLLSILAAQCESDHPKGCYLAFCQSEVAGGQIPKKAAFFLNEAGNATQKLLTEVFSQDSEAIALGLDQAASNKALYLATVLKGTASMARSGVNFPELAQVIDHSLCGIGLKQKSVNTL